MQAVIIFIILLVAAGIVAATYGFFHKGEDKVASPKAAECASCSVAGSAMCEQECQLEAAVKPIEYYDDEELDRFKGRPSGSFTDEEAEEFENIMLTMRPEEVSGWNRSLILRGVNVPDQIKDELIAIIEDSRGTVTD